MGGRLMRIAGSAFYAGHVMHYRTRPKQHRLRYRIFYLLIDLAELDTLASTLRLFSRNRFNLFSFHDRDHGDGSGRSLAEQVHHQLRIADIEADGPIRLLTLPRMLGYVFNPLSVYFCHRRDGSLAAILYEVTNTFRQRHNYLIPVAAGSGRVVRQTSGKSLYVSPFLSGDIRYSFTVLPPGERISVSVTGCDLDGPLIFAKLSGSRQIITDRVLARAFLVYPLLTLKVMLGIHWEALLLWLKGIRLLHRPPAPARSTTVGRETHLRIDVEKEASRSLR
jgi:DUF1365 family protein